MLVRAMRSLMGRGLVTLLVGVLAIPSVSAQAPIEHARVGVLLFSSPEADPNFAAFRQAMTALGHVEAKNLTLLLRYAEAKPERLPALANELVALKPDLIMALGGDVAPAVRTATSTIPIVIAVSNDPVRAGLVPSLARPGGNITGVTFVSSELAGKRLQYLKELAPAVSRVAVIWNPNHVDPEYAATQAAGRVLGIRVQSLEVRTLEDLDGAFQAAEAGRAEAIIVVSSRLTSFGSPRIIELAARSRMPVVAGWGAWTQSGALFSYGPDLNVSIRRAATHVDRILKGARPGDLAVEQPTRYDLIINVKTATALGLTVPPSLLLQATRLIE